MILDGTHYEDCPVTKVIAAPAEALYKLGEFAAATSLYQASIDALQGDNSDADEEGDDEATSPQTFSSPNVDDEMFMRAVLSSQKVAAVSCF